MQIAEHHREQFELAYATAWAKDRDGGETPEQLAAEIKAWRVGDTYEAEFIRLRFGWEGYQWARAGQCLAQIEEPAQPVAEICSASQDDAQFGERAIKPLRDISGFEYGTPLYAGAAPAAVAGPTAVELQMLAAKHTRSVATPTGYVCDAVAAVKEALARWGAAPALEAPAANAGDEAAAFNKWFQGEQGKPYQGMWEFARAAWMARAATAAAPQAPAAPPAVALPAMPPTDDRRPYDDADPEGYMESDNEWLDRNLAAVRWFIDNHAAVRALAASLAAPAAPAVDASDTARIDWLLTKAVSVREPMRDGPREIFWAGPVDRAGMSAGPSDLRARIDAAQAAAKGEHDAAD